MRFSNYALKSVPGIVIHEYARKLLFDEERD